MFLMHILCRDIVLNVKCSYMYFCIPRYNCTVISDTIAYMLSTALPPPPLQPSLLQIRIYAVMICIPVITVSYQGLVSKLCLLSLLLTAEFCADNQNSLLTVQLSCITEDCMWGTHVHKQKFSAHPWNMLDIRVELPASVSADSLVTVSRAMTLGVVQQSYNYACQPYMSTWWLDDYTCSFTIRHRPLSCCPHLGHVPCIE